ncbi:MAG: TraB/GumN family protein [Kiloniellaceae bacterium]
MIERFGGYCRLRQYLVALAATLLLAGCAPQLPTVMPGEVVETLPEPAVIPHGEGRIWQVDYPGQEPSYLFGTLHVTNPSVFDLPEAAETAFAGAKFAAFESELRADVTEEEKELYMELPADVRLFDIVGEETYRRMKALFLFRYFNVEGLDRLQPWVVWSLIAGREISIDIRSEEGRLILDDWLQERAAKEGKQVVHLETPAEQMLVFAGMPMEDQLSMLRSAIDGYGETQVKVEHVQLYLQGKLAVRYALWQRFLGHMEPTVAQSFNERMVSGRNRSMTEDLLPAFARGSTFVAVGAMHMPGEDGILRLLEQRGYTVTWLQ